MMIQLLAVTVMLLGLAGPAEELRVQDEEAAWTALYAVIPQNQYPRRSRVRVIATPEIEVLTKNLEKLLPELAGTGAEPIARYYLGNYYFNQNRLEDALKTFKALKADFPSHGLNQPFTANEPSVVGDAIADTEGEIELRKTYQVMDLPKAELDRSGRAVFHTAEGSFEIQCHETASPKTVANFKKLVEDGYYVGLSFHELQSYRKLVIGCPNTRDEMKGKDTWGQGGPGHDLPVELNDALHSSGAVSMNLNTAGRSHGSQFTICLVDQPDLNNKQVVFGRVVKGLDILRRLSQKRADSKGRPEDLIQITGSEWAQGPPGR